jgi:hypothetical protein
MTSILKVDSIQNAAGTAAITIDSSGLALPSVLDYRSMIFPATTPRPWNVLVDADISSTTGNTITATLSSSTGGLGYNTDATISGLTTGIYEFHMFASHDRTSSASTVDLRVQLLEGGTQIIQNRATSPSQKHVATSFSIIRDYTSSVPASVVLRWDADRSNYPTQKGNGFIIKRIG